MARPAIARGVYDANVEPAAPGPGNQEHSFRYGPSGKAAAVNGTLSSSIERPALVVEIENAPVK